MRGFILLVLALASMAAAQNGARLSIPASRPPSIGPATKPAPGRSSPGVGNVMPEHEAEQNRIFQDVINARLFAKDRRSAIALMHI